MTNKMELNNMGLLPMSDDEMVDVIGGGFWKILCGITGAVVGFLAAGVAGGVLGLAAGLIIGDMIDNPDTWDKDWNLTHGQR